jgi:hypothetical protein
MIDTQPQRTLVHQRPRNDDFHVGFSSAKPIGRICPEAIPLRILQRSAADFDRNLSEPRAPCGLNPVESVS